MFFLLTSGISLHSCGFFIHFRPSLEGIEGVEISRPASTRGATPGQRVMYIGTSRDPNAAKTAGRNRLRSWFWDHLEALLSLK